jgi:hypothetical protein
VLRGVIFSLLLFSIALNVGDLNSKQYHRRDGRTSPRELTSGRARILQIWLPVQQEYYTWLPVQHEYYKFDFRYSTNITLTSGSAQILHIWLPVQHEYYTFGVRHPQHTQTCSNSSTIAADSSNGVTNTRCWRYNCMRSWWCVEIPPETCRAVSRCK